MTEQRSQGERIVQLEEVVAMLRMSNVELSNTVAQMQRKVDVLTGQISNMDTAITTTAVPRAASTTIAPVATESSASGSVNILQHHIKATSEESFQEQRLTALEEAFGELNAKVLEKMTQMQKTINELRDSYAKQGVTNIKQEVSNMELTSQKSDVNMLDKGMAGEYQRSCSNQRDMSKDTRIVSSATASTSPASAFVPFRCGATTTFFNSFGEKKTGQSFSNTVGVATAATQGSSSLLRTISVSLAEILSEELFNVAGRGKAERIRQLVAEGATFLYRGKHGLTALHRAAGRDHVDAVRALVELGAPLEVEDNNKSRPLHYAALYECEDSVKVLLSAGANVNARDKNEQTPLHLAAVQESLIIVEILMAAGADRRVRDEDGKTPKDYAWSEALRALL